MGVGEVVDASVKADRAVKIPLYARAGLPEVWLVDLVGEGVELYRRPAPAGYAEVHRHRRGERASSQAVPELDLSVDEILG